MYYEQSTSISPYKNFRLISSVQKNWWMGWDLVEMHSEQLPYYSHRIISLNSRCLFTKGGGVASSELTHTIGGRFYIHKPATMILWNKSRTYLEGTLYIIYTTRAASNVMYMYIIFITDRFTPPLQAIIGL